MLAAAVPRETEVCQVNALSGEAIFCKTLHKTAIVSSQTQDAPYIFDCMRNRKLLYKTDFSGYGSVPPLPMICPKYATLDCPKVHLLGFNRIFASLKRSKTAERCSRCSSKVLENTTVIQIDDTYFPVQISEHTLHQTLNRTGGITESEP